MKRLGVVLVLAALCLATTVLGPAVRPHRGADPEAVHLVVADLQRRLFGPPLQSAGQDHHRNVKHLSLAWLYDLPGAGGTIKATPLQIDGVLYFTIPDHAYAVEARTGREIWHYTWTRNRGGIHIGNRGVAVLGDSLYFVTPDCNLVALDIASGKERWFKEYCSTEMVYYGSVAPVVVKDQLIVGVSGDDLDMPAYLDARNPKDGELIWRWYVTPQKAGDPGLDTWPTLDMAQHGGGMTWQPITYDPDLNLIYVTTGNPQPVVASRTARAPTCTRRRSWRSTPTPAR